MSSSAARFPSRPENGAQSAAFPPVTPLLAALLLLGAAVAGDPPVTPEAGPARSPAPQRQADGGAATPSGGTDSPATKVSDMLRPWDTGKELSGITWAGGDLYYAVDDADTRLYPLVLPIDRASGAIDPASAAIGEGVALSGGGDVEGCAFDPATRHVWASDESPTRIGEFDPATGVLLRTAPLPAPLATHRPNLGLEALSISPDGATMWTANEEALPCDGPVSSPSSGTWIRIARFTREADGNGWTPSGQFAYRADPIRGPHLVHRSRSGVSGLAALPDGTLLVLERELHGVDLRVTILPAFRLRLYLVDPRGAADISAVESLADGATPPLGKRLLCELDTALENVEGICLGPELDDGSRVLVLVADAGSSMTPAILTLRLSLP